MSQVVSSLALKVYAAFAIDGAGWPNADLFTRVFQRFNREDNIPLQIIWSDWTVENRLETAARVIFASLFAVRNDSFARLLKFPGRTPNAETAQEFLDIVGLSRADVEEMAKSVATEFGLKWEKVLELALGASPNATWRSLLKCDLARRLVPGLMDILQQPVFDIKGSDLSMIIPSDLPEHLRIQIQNGQRIAEPTRHVLVADTESRLKVSFKPHNDNGEWVLKMQETLSAGSPVEILHDPHIYYGLLHDFALDEAERQGAELTLATKATVMKALDGSKVDGVHGAYHRRRQQFDYPAQAVLEGALGKVKDSTIVDATMAWYYTKGAQLNPGQKRLAYLPNTQYGPYLKALLEALKTHGHQIDFRKNQVHSYRFSGGKGRNYGGLNEVAKTDGILRIELGSQVYEFPVYGGDAWAVNREDYALCKQSAQKFFANCVFHGDDHVTVVYDWQDPFEGQLVHAVTHVYREEFAHQLPNFDPEVDIVSAASALVQIFTAPKVGSHMVGGDNLFGDLLSDFLLDLTGCKAAYTSSGVQGVEETSVGGTAIDQGESTVKENKNGYNPLGTVLAYAQTLRNLAKAVRDAYPEDAEAVLVAECMETQATQYGKGWQAVYRKGIVTPDMRGKLRDTTVSEIVVDSRVWNQALLVEVLCLRGEDSDLEQAMLEDMILNFNIHRESSPLRSARSFFSHTEEVPQEELVRILERNFLRFAA